MTDDNDNDVVVMCTRCAKCDEVNDVVLFESRSMELGYEQILKADEADYLLALVRAVKCCAYEMAAMHLDRSNKLARLVVHVAPDRECTKCGATLQEMIAEVEVPDGLGFRVSTGS